MEPAAPATGAQIMRGLIFWLAISAFASSTAVRISDPLFPPVAAEFGVTVGQASIIAAAYALAYGLCQLIYGPLGDRFDKLRLVLTSTLMASAAVFACGLAPSLDMLAAARLISGAFAAGIIPLSMAYIGDAVPYEQRQNTLAKLMAGTISGVIFGQAAGGFLIEYIDWRAVFFVLAGILLIAALGLGLSIRSLEKQPPMPAKGLKRTVGDLVGLLRRKGVFPVVGAVFLEGAIVLGVFAYLGSHLHDQFGLRMDQVGLVLAVFGFGGLTYALFATFLVRTLGERGLVLIGGAMISLAMMAAAASSSVTAFYFIAAVTGMGFTMLHNTLQTRATQMAPESRGSAVSLFASMFFMGQMVGVAIAGWSYDRWGAPLGFGASAVLTPLLAAAFALHLARIKNENGRSES